MLAQERKQRRLSQQELARRTSLAQSHLSNIENGKIDPLASTILEIARVLELEPVLVPRRKLAAVKAEIRETNSQQPLYQIDDQAAD